MPSTKVSKGYLIFLGAILFVVLLGLGTARFPLVLAFVMAYLLFPIVQWAELNGMKRNHVVVSVFSLTVGLIVLLGLFVLPGVYNDALSFGRELPNSVERALVKIQDVAAEKGYAFQAEIRSVGELAKTVLGGLNVETFQSIAVFFGKGLGKGVSNIVDFVLGLLSIFLFPVFFYFIVNDYERIQKDIRGAFPRAWNQKLTAFLKNCNTAFSGYIRGQILVALILAGLYSIGLSIVGLKFGLVIGLMTGLLSIIPYVGFALGFVSALIVMLADFQGYNQVFAVLAVFAIIQIFESIVLTPKFVGQSVGLSTLSTMLALIVGGNLAGLPGMLLAVPVAAILRDSYIDYRKTAW